MGKSNKDVLQGTLTLLVLRTLEARGALHGYGLWRHIESTSDELLRVEEGSLYPALHRMTQAGWLDATWGKTEKGRRARFYKINAKGRRQLEAEKQSWERLTRGVAMILRPVEGV